MAARSALVLALLAALAALTLTSVHQVTRDAIEEAERRAALKPLEELYPALRESDELLALSISSVDLSKLGAADNAVIHAVKRDGQILGFIIPIVAPDGYSGAIHLLAGIDSAGTLTGVRAVRHSETAGLGDNIEPHNSEWILGFDGKSLGNPVSENWKIKKDGGDFDQLSGATITSRAVVTRVHQLLLFFAEHRDALMQSAAATETSAHE